MLLQQNDIHSVFKYQKAVQWLAPKPKKVSHCPRSLSSLTEWTPQWMLLTGNLLLQQDVTDIHSHSKLI